MVDDRRKIIAEINGWIEGHIPFREKNRIKAEINRRSNEEIRQLQELISNKQDLSPDDFKQRLQELKEEQKQRQDSPISQPEKNTGEEQMSDTNAEEKLTDKEKAFKEKYFSDRNIDDEALKKIYEDCKNINDEQEIKAILGLLPPKKEKELITLSDWDEAKDKTADPKNNTDQNKGPTTVDENEPKPATHASNEKSEWMNGLLEQYQTAYDANPQTKNQYNINGEPNDEGLLITIDPKEEGKTGTVAQYYDRNHFAIRTSTKGVEPKDQSFEHFKNHIAVAQKNGSDEIVMGNTKSAVFRTKLAAAVLATEGMSLHMSSKGIDSLDFSLETLKEIPVETQGKLLEFALKNGVEIENPILDFNNEAVKNLPEELKYKYLATLLKNEDAKGQIKNAPEIDLFKKDNNGKRIPTKTIFTILAGGKVHNLKTDENGELLISQDKDGKLYGTIVDSQGNETPKRLEKNIDNDGNVSYSFMEAAPQGIYQHKVNKMVYYQQYSPENSNFSKEDLETLRGYKREQQLKNIRENSAEKASAHDKVSALRTQLKGKTGEDRKTTLTEANVTEQEYGVNFYKYAQKHTPNTN